MSLTTLLLIHAAATWFMTGVIWLVQVVHYPLFAAVGRDAFESYEQRHVRRIMPVVGTAMLIEFSAAVWLLLRPEVDRALSVPGIALVGLLCLSTAVFQMPMHGRLSKGWDAAVGRRLVATNWIRTVAWSARAVIAALMLAEAM